ncbi:hypothetical protein DFH29DRAFT_897194 [Suillus ampliporus]|nr:hypothetical protein DFH29DRAFT_897194 [Suillus ampliporus]
MLRCLGAGAVATIFLVPSDTTCPVATRACRTFRLTLTVSSTEWRSATPVTVCDVNANAELAGMATFVEGCRNCREERDERESDQGERFHRIRADNDEQRTLLLLVRRMV